MSKKKINNNEPIAPDQALGKAEEFVLKYKKTFIAVILAIIIFAALKAFNVFSSSNEENPAANQAIANIEYYALSGDFGTALNGDGTNMGLLEIIDTYGGTGAANKAHLYAGIIYAQQKQYEEAINHLSQYSGADNLIAAKAKQTLGNCYSQIGDYNTAISLVLEAGANANNVAVTPTCWRDAAAMYEELGNADEALKLYNRIKDEFPYSPVAREANIKINATAK